jgi:hypothetical protein
MQMWGHPNVTLTTTRQCLVAPSTLDIGANIGLDPGLDTSPGPLKKSLITLRLVPISLPIDISPPLIPPRPRRHHGQG